eukprot:scaffold578364_cov19-Prasinocladus_malaysianus.AAC.1
MDGYEYELQYDTTSYRAPRTRTGTIQHGCRQPSTSGTCSITSTSTFWEAQAKAAIRTRIHTNTTQINWSSLERDREHRPDSIGWKSPASPWLGEREPCTRSAL